MATPESTAAWTSALFAPRDSAASAHTLVFSAAAEDRTLAMSWHGVPAIIPCWNGDAASTRVSNELGAGNADKARLVVWVAMFLAVAETVAVSILLLCLRHVLGRAYSTRGRW